MAAPGRPARHSGKPLSIAGKEGLAERVEAFRRELEAMVRFAGELLRAAA
jgi:hypothetical protein